MARDLKRLYKHSFQIENKAANQNIEFNIPSPYAGWPRTGLEAYVVLVNCDHPTRGRIPSVLKIFKQDVPERASRTEFLIQLGLAKYHPWLFRGMPYAAIKQMTINGVRIVAHIAQQILGHKGSDSDDILLLRQKMKWNYNEDVRRRLAGHVSCAVFAFEMLQFVHGDLSARNVIIGAAPDGGPAALLCDFDGFSHATQASLPTEYEGLPCRPIGSSGYQYPSLLQRMASQNLNTYVETDRFALAVLICEIMIWSDHVAERLGRDQLLDDDIIITRNLNKIPYEIVKQWEAGFVLLERAVKARDIESMPSPFEWLCALGVPMQPELLRPQTGFKGRPHVEIRKRRGNAIQKIAAANLKNDRGDFRKVDAQLQQVEFIAPGTALTFQLKWNAQILLCRNGRLIDLGKGPGKVPLQPTDILYSNQWEFHITDSQP